LKEKTEVLGLVFGGLSVLLFWVPPIGLFLGIAGLIISATQLKLNRRFRKTAVVISVLGILAFVVFWGGIWIASQ
jgi:hypothetical protein